MDKRKVIGIVKNFILFLLFLAGLFLLIFRFAKVLRDKENPPVQYNFAELERDSVDTVFIGTSHQFCSINPEILYEDYGIDSFMLATSAQTVPMSYYAAMEAIELQHPKTIIMEMLYCTNDFRTVTPGMSHAFFDGMPNCEAKHLAIKDLVEEEGIYYYLNLGRYHDRWRELTEADFQNDMTMPRGGYVNETITYNWEIPVIDRSEKEDMPEEMRKYVDMLIALCKKENVRLIWYVAPFNSMYNDEDTKTDLFRRQRIFNSIEDLAAENNIPYYNLFYELDAIGLSGDTDFMDSQHLNCYGQEKLTRYMAERGYFTVD